MPSSTSPVTALLRHRYLLGQLVRRDVLLKYRGSFLGIGWSFLYPLLLLFAFGLVFERIVGVRWGSYSGVSSFLVIYAGLVVFTPFSETASSAPRLILGYQNYVKKIIFPTEILPVMLASSAGLHALINALLLLLAAILFAGFHASQALLPLVLLPAFLFILGVAWFLAAAGVFVRDLVHVMPVLMQMLMFLSPVFYPTESVPASLRWLHHLNPLSLAIENVRRAVLLGQSPDWPAWLAGMLIGTLAALLGYAFFMRGKEEFADVL